MPLLFWSRKVAKSITSLRILYMETLKKLGELCNAVSPQNQSILRQEPLCKMGRKTEIG